jgi:hypothetical protein
MQRAELVSVRIAHVIAFSFVAHANDPDSARYQYQHGIFRLRAAAGLVSYNSCWGTLSLEPTYNIIERTVARLKLMEEENGNDK